MIRTLCYSLLALGLAATSARAQEAKPPFHQSLAVGVHGGMLLSRVNFVPSVSQRLHSGLMGGVLLRYNVERGASLQLEANYVQGGWREKYDAATTSYSRTLNALEVPLLTHLYLGYLPQGNLHRRAGRRTSQRLYQHPLLSGHLQVLGHDPA